MDRRKIVCLVLILIVSALWFNCQKASKGSVLDVQVKGLDDKDYNLTGTKGDLILVNFWATWCPPCKQEIPELIKLQEEYKDKGLGVVGISMDSDGTKKVKQFVEDYKINYTVFIGSQEVVQRYGGFYGIPVSFLVTKEGIIQKAYIGSLNKETVEKDLKTLLKK
ncbi:MAG: TlpA family protein disulfide reductase [candidate division Zixibacteria bacterium]|nr:TlpA family protein disulfide reductase [candidate division Zixibacteria bacterium]